LFNILELVSYLARPFIIETREIEVRERGTLPLTDRERAAYRVAVTVDVRSAVGRGFPNFKVNPERNHFGFLTFFLGAAVVDEKPLRFVKERVYDEINPEARQDVLFTEVQLAFVRILEQIFQYLLDSGLGSFPALTLEFLFAVGQAVGLIVEPESGTFQYVLPPRLSPFPSEIKFSLERLAQVRVRITSWHFVDQVTQALVPVTDPNDPTDGEDERPIPDNNASDNPYGTNPPQTLPSELGSAADPRDFGVPEGPFTVTVLVNGTAQTNTGEIVDVSTTFSFDNDAGPFTAAPGPNDGSRPPGVGIGVVVTSESGASQTRGTAGWVTAQIGGFEIFPLNN
jgi:hypothetical protein